MRFHWLKNHERLCFCDDKSSSSSSSLNHHHHKATSYYVLNFLALFSSADQDQCINVQGYPRVTSRSWNSLTHLTLFPASLEIQAAPPVGCCWDQPDRFIPKMKLCSISWDEHWNPQIISCPCIVSYYTIHTSDNPEHSLSTTLLWEAQAHVRPFLCFFTSATGVSLDHTLCLLGHNAHRLLLR